MNGSRLPRRSDGESSPWPDGSLARRAASLCISPALALGNPVQPRPGPAASHSIPSLTAPSATDPPPDNRRSPQTRASPLRDGLLLHAVPPISPSAAAVVRHWRPERQLPTAANLPSTRIEPGPSRSHAPHPVFQRQDRIASVDSGLRGYAEGQGRTKPQTVRREGSSGGAGNTYSHQSQVSGLARLSGRGTMNL